MLSGPKQIARTFIDSKTTLLITKIRMYTVFVCRTRQPLSEILLLFFVLLFFGVVSLSLARCNLPFLVCCCELCARTTGTAFNILLNANKF